MKPDEIVRGMMDIIIELHSSQQMDYMKRYTCALASREVSVLALASLMN